MTVTATAATVLAWVPPAFQQLRGDGTGGPGNITLLVGFFTAPADGGFTLNQGLAAISRLVTVPITGAPPPEDLVAAPLAGPAQFVVLAFVGCCCALAAAGWGCGARQGSWTGVLTAVALLAAAQAVTGVRGPVYTYLLQWSFALPLALAVGWCDVAARLLSSPPIGRRHDMAQRGGWTLVAVAAALSVLAGIRAAGAPTQSDSPGVGRLTAELAPVVRAELPAREGPDLVLDIRLDDDWPLAAGLSLWLREDEGREVLVPQRWVALFGADRGPGDRSGADRGAPDPGTGAEALPVLTVLSAREPPPAGARQVAAAETERGPVELWLTPAGS